MVPGNYEAVCFWSVENISFSNNSAKLSSNSTQPG
jgi:hypothetical protein